MHMIQKIPDQLISMIAAGEVIQTPTSLLKECIENSLDAQATNIKISINKKENIIEIKDNGIGINQKDLKYLTKRHYTSKLTVNKSTNTTSTIDVLFKLHTFGFRGEALCSISLLSNLEVRTKFEGEKLGIHATFKGEDLIEDSLIPIPLNNSGTTIIIKNLFYNLKDKAVLNIKQIFNLINAFKIFHLETDFELIVDNKSIITPSLLCVSPNIQPVNNILVENEDKRVSIQKILIATNYLRANTKDLSFYKTTSFYFIFNNYINSKSTLRNDLYSFNDIFICFINKRLVCFRKLQERVKETYLFKSRVKKSFIFYIEIFLDLNKVDVNIHPSKQEVLLENEEDLIEEICLSLNKLLSEVNSCDFEISNNLKGIKKKETQNTSFKKVYDFPSQKSLNFLMKVDESVPVESSFTNLTENKETWKLIKSQKKHVKFTSLREIREEYKLTYVDFKDIKYKLHTLIYVGKDEEKLFFQHESALVCMNFKGVLHKFMLLYFLNEFANFDSIRLNIKPVESIKQWNDTLFELIHEYFKVKIEIQKEGLKILEIPICQVLKPENSDFTCFFNEFTLNEEFLKKFVKDLVLIEMKSEKKCFLKILKLFVNYFSIQITNDVSIYKDNISSINSCRIFNSDILQKSTVENYLIMRIAKLKPNISFDEHFEYLTDLKNLYSKFGR